MGFFKSDSSWLKTHDMFLRKGSLVTDYVVEQIDNGEYSQILRRLCRYMTINPLTKKSKDYANKDVTQYELKDSLLKPTLEGTYFTYTDADGKLITSTSKECLFNGSFNQEMKRVEQCFIFIHNYRNKPTSDDSGKILIKIDVIIPDKYDTIIDFDSGMSVKRGSVICFLIDDMLNHRTIVDEKYSKYTGSIEFKLEDFLSSRLTKTSDGVVYSLYYSLSTARGEILNGNL